MDENKFTQTGVGRFSILLSALILAITGVFAGYYLSKDKQETKTTEPTIEEQTTEENLLNTQISTQKNTISISKSEEDIEEEEKPIELKEECENKIIGIKLKYPEEEWKCDSKSEDDKEILQLKNEMFDILVSDHKTEYSCKDFKYKDQCKIETYYTNDLLELSSLTYKDEIKRIFGNIESNELKVNAYIYISITTPEEEKLEKPQEDLLKSILESMTAIEKDNSIDISKLDIKAVTLDSNCNKGKSTDTIIGNCYSLKDKDSGAELQQINSTHPLAMVALGTKEDRIQYIYEQGSEGGDVWLTVYAYDMEKKSFSKVSDLLTLTQDKYFTTCRETSELCQDLSSNIAYEEECFGKKNYWHSDWPKRVEGETKSDVVQYNIEFYTMQKKYTGRSGQIEMEGIECY